MRLPAVQSRGRRGRAQRPAHGELTVLTAQEGYMQAPFRDGLHFPLRQASEEIFRPTGICAPVYQQH